MEIAEKHMSTIRDVAALANVSAATVSRILNHDTKYKMTEETIERVWKAVAELNYKAPTSSREQMRRVRRSSEAPASVKKLGCILNIRGSKYNDPYYLTILSGFEKRAMEKGYEIAFIRTIQELENNQILYKTFDEPISGLVIMNTLTPETFSYIKKQTPYIVGIDTDYTEIDNVAYDHYDASFKAVEHLVNKGYKRIGFIGGFRSHLNRSKRFNGFYAALHCHGLEYNPDYVLCSQWNEDHLDEEIKEAYRKGVLPEAFFVASDHMAIGALRSFFDLGLSVPKDIAVIGLSNIELSKYSNPPLTTISLPIEEMGQVAANVLFERIAGDTTPTKIVTLGCEVVERSST